MVRYLGRTQAGLRMLVYSGDVDGIVPVVGTRRWVASLRLKVGYHGTPWPQRTVLYGIIVQCQDGLQG